MPCRHHWLSAPLALCALAAIAGLAVAPSAAAEPTITFGRDVMAVLSKAGCNAGNCHGNQNGKGGFKLSLRGQHPTEDYTSLVRQYGGRRVDLLAPDQSLILRKATGQVAHLGGTRFRPGDLEYRILRRWLAAGAPSPDRHPPQLLSLQVSPPEAVTFGAAPDLQLRVVAQFAGEPPRDVTRLACYETSNLLATVEIAGRVVRQRYGQTTVIVRYLDRQVAVPVALMANRPAPTRPPATGQSRLDEFALAKLRRLRIEPSPRASDPALLRRTYLDTLGVLPTSNEARAFSYESRPDKHARLVDRLLSRPEFADFWALKWSDVLRNEEKVLDARGVDVFHDWIRAQIAAGLPWDQFVRALLRSEGSTYENPPANYWRANRTPAIRAETTARLFLGTRLQCAQCHNHPFDRWTQDDYYSWAAVFALVDYEIVDNKRSDKFDKNEFKGEQRVVVNGNLGVTDPRSDHFAAPQLLGAETLGPGTHYDRLTPMAVWLTGPENRQFARAQVNFVWYHLLGRGLVEPIDDFRLTNPASNPPLLEELASQFIRSAFDLPSLVRRILASQIYQRSAQPTDSNRADDIHFSRAEIKRLPAEVLLDAQTQVLGAPATFVGYPAGMRAVQIPGVRRLRRRDTKPANGDRFLKTFGKPERLLACECERSNETTLKQALVLVGGAGIHDRLRHQDNALTRLLEQHAEDPELVTELYWRTLNRAPDSVESKHAVSLLGDAQRLASLPVERPVEPGSNQQQRRQRARREALEDICWALLNAKEFLFRH
ncbi:MAG: DUF1549 and DUF1553 domain-containing protein [Planctomycetota bacterium]|nr:DUF1549 and DUF1553 domain-containing protein [Planctomycetota bacterium]